MGEPDVSRSVERGTGRPAGRPKRGEQDAEKQQPHLGPVHEVEHEDNREESHPDQCHVDLSLGSESRDLVPWERSRRNQGEREASGRDRQTEDEHKGTDVE